MDIKHKTKKFLQKLKTTTEAATKERELQLKKIEDQKKQLERKSMHEEAVSLCHSLITNANVLATAEKGVNLYPVFYLDLQYELSNKQKPTEKEIGYKGLCVFEELKNMGFDTGILHITDDTVSRLLPEKDNERERIFDETIVKKLGYYICIQW
jgi:hypothetical protein